MSQIQAILFNRKAFDNTNKARKWLKKHNFKPIKRAHTTEKYYRYRLKEPKYDDYYYRIIKKHKGIDFIIQFKKS